MTSHADPSKAASILTAKDLICLVRTSDLPETRKRDLISAVSRISEMAGVSPAQFPLTTQLVRRTVDSIRPAAHGISGKTFATLQSNLRAALALAVIIDSKPKCYAEDHPSWGALVEAVATSRKLSLGLSRFMNFCANAGIKPVEVGDATVIAFLQWLTERTIQRNPNKVARAIPRLWNIARATAEAWPIQHLSELTVGLAERKTSWGELPSAFRSEAEAYLELRRRPDPFDEHPYAPTRPLAEGTIRQQREHIRLAFDVLAGLGIAPSSLAELVEPDRVRAVLRYYHTRAGHEPNAFAVLTAKTLISIAKIYVRLDLDQLNRLKKIASRLPSIPFDLTAKNKQLISKMKDERLLGALLALPARLMRQVGADLKQGRRDHGSAHVALAIAILLAAPVRSQNLIALNFRKHIRMPSSGRSSAQLLIPANETKTGRADLAYELDPETTNLLRSYRSDFLPAIGADPNGYVFAMPNGKTRGQPHLSTLITDKIERLVGVRMTPHQFRHLAADLYLTQHPQDFESVRQLLGHQFGKTTLVYAGSSGERASRSYGEVVHRKREEIKQKAPRRRRKPRASDIGGSFDER